MFIKNKNYLRNISRIRVAEGRNLDNGLRLDRNERVDSWGNEFLINIFKEKPDYFLSIYPELDTLYKKISSFHNVSEENLLLTSGIDGGIKTIFEILTSPKDTVGVVSPTYAMYMVYSNLFNTSLFEIEYLKNLEFNFKQFELFLDQNPKVFFLPNPNQPIESCFSLKELRNFAQKTLEKKCLFFIDEAYYFFGAESSIELINEFPNVVVARTFSKGFGVPSIRLGYLISSKENMEVLSKTRFAHESNALSNSVAEYLIDNFEVVENYNQRVIESREYIKKELANLNFEAIGNYGNYLLIDLRTNSIAHKLVRELRDNQIYVKGPWKEPWENYITISIGPKESMQRFLDLFHTFCKKLND